MNGQILRVRLRRFIARYFGWLVNIFLFVKMNNRAFRLPPVIILTYGKVGSSSVYRSLKSQLSNPVFHVHNLSSEGIELSEKSIRASDRKSLPLHLRVSKLLSKKLDSYQGDIYLISLIREPVSREISSFFQNTDLIKETIETKNLSINLDNAVLRINQTLNSGIVPRLNKWIYREIQKPFGIDFYNSPNLIARGYEIFESTNCKLLLMRMEDLDAAFSTGIEDFLNTGERINLYRDNIGQKKHYASVYTEAKKLVRINSQTKTELLESDFVKAFYPTETERFLNSLHS